MKRLYLPHSILWCFLLLFFFASCSVEPEFVMNEQPILSSDMLPAVEDSMKILHVLQGDTILIRDVSDPQGNVKKRIWKIDGDRKVELDDNSFFPLSFTQTGFHKITLCVNEIEPCLSKWVNVKFAYPDDEFPLIEVLKPSGGVASIKGKNIAIEVKIENIESEEAINLLLNGSPLKKYSFDAESGLLTANVRLSESSNTIEIVANTDKGTDSDVISVESDAFSSRKEPPSAPPSPPTVRIAKPGDRHTTDQSSQLIEVKTSGVKQKSQINFLINGQPHSSYRFSRSRQRWVSNLPLREGDNNIEVIVQNSAGKSNDQIIVTYNKPVVVEARKPAPPPPPPPPPPVVEEEWEGKVAWTGVRPASVGSSCTDFSVSNGAVKMTPSRAVRLMGGVVYASGCGSLTIRLSGGGSNIKETFELNENKNQLTFYKLDDIELNKNIDYSLYLETGKSSNCPGGAPQLLNAASCGQNSTGDKNLSVSYGGKVCLFNVKYQY